jgi:hypothetical protein
VRTFEEGFARRHGKEGSREGVSTGWTGWKADKRDLKRVNLPILSDYPLFLSPLPKTHTVSTEEHREEKFQPDLPEERR